MKRILVLILLSLLILTAQTFAATIYYLDNTNGNDSNTGTSPSTAWKTIEKINNSWGIINTGDQILLKRGEIFTETILSVEKGGTALNPLLIGAYGYGDKPIISNAPSGIRCWKDNISHIIIQDIEIKNIIGDSGISFAADGLSNITISRCDLNTIDHNGIIFEKVDTFIIENCKISNCENCGIVIHGSQNYKATNGIIRNNIIYNIAYNDGISLHINPEGHGIGPNHQILNNLLYYCAEQGLDITSGSNIIARYNETFSNGDSGILVGGDVNDVWIDKHFSHEEINMGIIINEVSNLKLTNSIIVNSNNHSLIIGDSANSGRINENSMFFNNTIIHNNDTSIIDVCPGTNNLSFKNNLIISTLNFTPGIFLRYLMGKTPQNTNSDFNNNIWWRPDGNSTLWYDSEQGKYDFSTWQSLYNQGQRSFFTDPLLEADYHLHPYSSGIDTGTDVGITSDFEGNPVPQGYGPDIGAYEYTPATPLQANLSGSPTSGYAPHDVNFTGSASGGTTPYTYSWDFGDGSSSSDQNPSHTYSETGDYPVILTVMDNDSNQDTATLTINVSEQVEPLQASVSASPTSGTAPLSVTFSGSASGGSTPYIFSWDFGEGSSSSLENPSFTYSQSGNFTATLTVTDNQGTEQSDSLSISVMADTPETQLSIAAVTASPAPGWGGTISPKVGDHNYPTGNSVNISAAANKDYRFAKWTGDISPIQAYENNINLTMDQNKNINAHFYTRCGDVNGDLKITPTDAQMVFELFLGLQPNATEAQLENADVNTDGTPSAPQVTPSDAQAIFEKFLGINDLPGDCSCKSRAGDNQRETFEQINSFPGQKANIKINDILLVPGKEIIVPVLISGTFSFKSFGFDLAYPPEILEFISAVPAAFSQDLVDIQTNQIADGVVRVGGYGKESVSLNSEKNLINLVFKVKKTSGPPSSFQIINKFDDFQQLTFTGGKLVFLDQMIWKRFFTPPKKI